jgi:DNA-binding CsgD family transcriptional regulator
VTLPSTLPTSQCIAGNYEGFSLFDFKNGQFLDSKPVETFNESSRFVEIDQNGDIWISHPYHGVYRIRKNMDGTSSTFHYANQNGLPSILNNHVYKIKNKIVIASEKGVFEFNSARNLFEPAPFFQKLLGNQSIRYLKEDMSGNIWFIHEKKLGVIDVSGKDPSVIYLPELNNKMLSGFEFIYPVNDNNIFLGGEKGFFHINYDKYKKTATDLQVQVRTVKITDKTDSLLFGGFFKSVNEAQLQPRENIPEVNNNWKTIRIEFSAALYGYQSSIEYSYRLKGFDDNWSDFTKRTDKEYTNLPAGDYIFEVKARNNLGKESPVAFYSFSMLPPWYQTIWASFAYVLMMVSLMAGLYKFLKKKFRVQRLRYEQEQQKLLYIHELERNKAETELISLGNEKLEAEISFKNSELASSAMHLVKKGELIAKVKGEITQIMKGLDNAQANTALKKMIKTLNEDDNMDKEWENFSKHFDKVQSDFLVDIKEIHPTLTGNELKLCAYLRMNLSTKEIAQLMNISARGVEISRYRLRKKLQIASEISIFDYLIKFQAKI